MEEEENNSILSKMYTMSVRDVVWKVKGAMSELVDDTFRWNLDDDGDIVFSVANLVHFTKYKNSTLVEFGKRTDLDLLPKRVKVEPVNWSF